VEVITTHRNVDFDALASVFAAKVLFPNAVAMLPQSLNSNVRSFLSLHKDHFPFVTVKDLDLNDIRRLIVVDAGQWSRIEGRESLSERKDLELFVIDHHAPGDIRADPLICRPVGAAVTLILNKVREEGSPPLSPIQATLFISGIYEDTGNLTFPSTTAEDARAVAFLLDQGADLNLVRDHLRSAYNPAQKEILFDMLRDERRISQNGYDVCIGYRRIEGHAPGLSLVMDMYHDMNGADATFGIFVDPGRAQVIVIGRSRPNTLDIGAIMKNFGGGGHPNAGSALLKSWTEQDPVQWITDLVKAGGKSPVQIADLMSFPVTTVTTGTSMKDAALLLREKGCTGLPVEEYGKVVGIISRRDFRKARKAAQMKSPVSAFMSSKVVHIRPDSPIGHAVSLMVNHDIGRLPVIQDGKLIGIITRSDAMRYFYDLMPE
jgi:nanoRNase/pAp phosphatase (c-di-AMP/oligoRNAs hydrolase)